jgi:hypothetical protein
MSDDRLEHGLQSVKSPPKLLWVLLQAGNFHSRQNLLKVACQFLHIDSTGSQKAQNVSKIFFCASLNLAQRGAVQIEMENIELAETADEERSLPVAVRKRNKFRRRASSTLRDSSSFSARGTLIRAA